MTAGNNQSVPRAYNKGIIIGFNISTNSGASTAVVTSAQIAAAGASMIRDIHLKLTGDDAFLGLGKTASTITSGNTAQDIVPIFQGAFFSKENVKYNSLNVIRAGSTDVTIKGYVVVG